MSRIVIKNFGPIKSADIEIKKTLVLIGEQATGKSTVAKLIFFFRTVVDDFLTSYLKSNDVEFNFEENLKNVTILKFHTFFGYPFKFQFFEVKYYYNEEKCLSIKLSSDKTLDVECSPSLIDEEDVIFVESIKSKIIELREFPKDMSSSSNENEIERYFQTQTLFLRFKELFESSIFINSLYLVAGREATVSFSDFFEKSFFATIQRRIEESQLKGIEQKSQSLEEILMFQFMESVSNLKDFYEATGGFAGAVIVSTDSIVKEILSKAETIINDILKGKYQVDSFGEKILINGTHVMLKDASSGQKESIRILQDLFYVMFNHHMEYFRIIEEPEAHLFPTAQQKLVELMALMRSANPENELIITTHSPYILTSINNLLYAKSISALDEKVNSIIAPVLQLDTNEFAAYALGDFNNSGEHCRNIFNNDTGVIDQSFLDTVSQMLGEEFDQLYRIHAKALRAQ